jgi:S1-C subfamily serine protease
MRKAMRGLVVLLGLWAAVPADGQVVGVVCTSPDGRVYQGTGVVESFMQVEDNGRVMRYGKVITAEHVIVAAGKVEIVMPSGARTTCQISAVNHDLDLALLTVHDFPEPIAPIKMARRANRGNRVTARNYAGQSVSGVINEVYPDEYTTTGGVTVRGRVISMTTPVVPGYSGGPILNEAGELVGISLAMGQPNYGICVSEVKGFIDAFIKAELQRMLRESRK